MARRAIGRLRRLARERHHRDLAFCEQPGGHPNGFYFDSEAGDRVVLFIERFCHHYKGEWAGKRIKLEDWQKDEIIRPLFGWKRADGTRRYRIGYVEVAKKNGKTLLAAGVGLYMMIGDQEGGAEVYSSATSTDQASLCFDAAAAMVKKSPPLKKQIQVFTGNLSCASLNAKFEPLSSDSDNKDGINPHCSIVDELHAHKKRDLWDVQKTAMAARRQPLMLAITTAGVYVESSIGWQQHIHATKVLEGSIQDDEYFAFIAAADKKDPIDKPKTWEKANPNLGISVKPAFLEAESARALTMTSSRNSFLRYHLNLWTNQIDAWIPSEKWHACEQELNEYDLEGRRCYMGLDLSTKLDISALALLFPPEHDGEKYHFLFRYWVPEDRVKEDSVRQSRVDYATWVRDGHLLTTPGNVVDYDFIKGEIAKLSARFQIAEVAYDPWNALQIALQLRDDIGLEVVEVPQSLKSLAEASKKFEELVVSRGCAHTGDPVTRWMVSNLVTRSDANNNIAPDKKRASGKIDGPVALITALARMIGNPDAGGGSVYDERGVIAFG